MENRIGEEIAEMAENDQKMRNSGIWDKSVDIQNTKRLKEIIQKHGWPGKSLVGEQNARWAWLLVQHADHDIEFQEHALGLLEKAVEAGDAEKQNLAYLIDRVRVNKGQAQLFGTQFSTNSQGIFGPREIEDRAKLAKHRAEYGLETFEEYEKRMQGVNSSFRQ